MAQIFISYSQTDRVTARLLRDRLIAANYTVWEDDNFDTGAAWLAEVSDAIQNASVIIALISHAYNDSRFTSQELRVALASAKPIIPVRLEEVTLPPELIVYQFIDATQDWEQAADRIVLALEASIGLAEQRKVNRTGKTAPVRPRATQEAQPAPASQAKRGFLVLPFVIGGVVLLCALVSVTLLSSSAPNPSSQSATLTAAAQIAGAATDSPVPSATRVDIAPTVQSGEPSATRPVQMTVVATQPPQMTVLATSGVQATQGDTGEPTQGDDGPRATRTPVLPVDAFISDIYPEADVLVVEVDALNEREIAAYVLYVVSEMTERVVASQRFETPPHDRLEFPLADLPTGDMVFILETLDEDNFLLARAQFPFTIEELAAPVPTESDPESIDQPDINAIVAATVIAMRATDESILSPQEAAYILRPPDNTPIVLTGILSALALGVAGATLAFIISGRGSSRITRGTAHRVAHPDQAAGAPPAPLLEAYEIFVSSSEKDKAWVNGLVEDLLALDYLVWWYAKDAPGLPFGNEIRSAIYHTKVFVIILSPDSMKSKHIEEEIRWAEIYDRPIIPVVCRAITVEERLYGLAKGADVDFTDDAEYKGSIELLTQAIDHYLNQRLQPLQGGTGDAKPPASGQG